MIPPILLLLVALLVTAAAALVSRFSRRTRASRLAKLAATWDMAYTAADRFQLTPRVATHFPTPGVADVVLRDLVYDRATAGCFRYLFTVEYTVGVLRTKRRRVGVGMLAEVCHPPMGDAYSAVTLAPADLSLEAQYDHLRRHGPAAG